MTSHLCETLNATGLNVSGDTLKVSDADCYTKHMSVNFSISIPDDNGSDNGSSIESIIRQMADFQVSFTTPNGTFRNYTATTTTLAQTQPDKNRGSSDGSTTSAPAGDKDALVIGLSVGLPIAALAIIIAIVVICKAKKSKNMIGSNDDAV